MSKDSVLMSFIIKHRVKNLNELLNLYNEESQQELIEMIAENWNLKKSPFVEDVIATLCHSHDLNRKELFSKSRVRYIIEARHIGYLLLYAGTNYTLKQIGFTIGKSDHATVLHGIKKVIDLYKFDSLYRNYIDEAVILLQDLGYNCELFKQRLNEQRTIKTSIRLTNFKSTIIRKPVELVTIKEDKNNVSTSNYGGSGGIFFGTNSVCVF